MSAAHIRNPFLNFSSVTPPNHKILFTQLTLPLLLSWWLPGDTSTPGISDVTFCLPPVVVTVHGPTSLSALWPGKHRYSDFSTPCEYQAWQLVSVCRQRPVTFGFSWWLSFQSLSLGRLSCSVGFKHNTRFLTQRFLPEKMPTLSPQFRHHQWWSFSGDNSFYWHLHSA